MDSQGAPEEISWRGIPQTNTAGDKVTGCIRSSTERTSDVVAAGVRVKRLLGLADALLDLALRLLAEALELLALIVRQIGCLLADLALRFLRGAFRAIAGALGMHI